ncbi:MAG: DUF3794 domain-containing protein [Defluviitaleaceae bacterium]|nr:DUF3794 domain-containing protein [Defluviitaleaceae bacterium]
MEFVRENIILSGHAGTARSQLLLEGDIIVPDIKPDIASVIHLRADLHVHKAQANASRIGYSGRLSVDVLYLAHGGETLVHSISALVPVDDFLNMDGALPGMMVNLDATLANVEHNIVNDRKLNYRVVVDVQATVWENRTIDAISAIEGLPSSQQKFATLSMHNALGLHHEQFIVRDEIVLPPTKPPVSELLQVGMMVSARDITLHQGRVDVSGILHISPLYRANVEESVIEFEEFELPFSGSLEVPHAHEGAFADVSLSIANRIVDVTPDAEGANRILAIEASIAAAISLSQNQELHVLEDAYCAAQNLEIETQSAEYFKLICRNKNQFNMKEAVNMVGAPDILQVLNVHGNVLIEEQKVIEDKVVVEGLVEADILYIAIDDNQPLHSYRAHLPFRQTIETKGAKAGMQADIRHSIDNINFNMLGSSEVELRFSLNFDTQIKQHHTMHFIKDIEASPLNPDHLDALPSMVILAASAGDSLWSVAKRYNADLDELAAINELEPDAEIVAGQKLLVVKKVVEA